MPTYDYRCKACEHTFELFQQMSAPVKKKCPECSKLQLERLIGIGAGVIFKGSGFYQTDYRSESYKADAQKATDGPKGDSKDKKKTDAASSGGDGSSSSSSEKKESTPKSKKDGAASKKDTGKKSTPKNKSD